MHSIMKQTERLWLPGVAIIKLTVHATYMHFKGLEHIKLTLAC